MWAALICAVENSVRWHLTSPVKDVLIETEIDCVCVCARVPAGMTGCQDAGVVCFSSLDELCEPLHQEPEAVGPAAVIMGRRCGAEQTGPETGRAGAGERESQHQHTLVLICVWARACDTRHSGLFPEAFLHSMSVCVPFLKEHFKIWSANQKDWNSHFAWMIWTFLSCSIFIPHENNALSITRIAVTSIMSSEI